MQPGSLSSSQKTEILRRQAFECNNCQRDLEPVGKAPPHFDYMGPAATKVASTTTTTANIVALCPDCHAESTPDHAKNSGAKSGRQKESETRRIDKRFLKTGFDNKKF